MLKLILRMILSAQLLLPFVLMMAAGIIAALLSVSSIQRRTAPGGPYFVLLMAAVAFFALTGAGKLTAASYDSNILWAKVSYLGIASVAPLWVLFTASFSRKTAWLSRGRAGALFLLPALTVGLVATNERHRLFWTAVIPLTQQPGFKVNYAFGPAFWFHAAYAYLLMLVGTIWLVQAARKNSGLLRRQTYVLILGALVPWLANILDVFHFNPWPGMDLTPIAFAITGAAITWNFYRFQLLDLAPIAREVLFDSLGDGVLVLDTQNRIVDINPTARGFMGFDEEAIGRSIFEVIPRESVLQQYASAENLRSQIELNLDGQRFVYDLTISPLRDESGITRGRVAWLHDISQERDLLDAARKNALQMGTLNAITRAALSTPNLHQMLQILADRLGELFGADGAYLTLWNEENESTTPAAAYGLLRDTYSSVKAEPGELTMTESVLREGRVLAVEDVFNTPYMSRHIAGEFPTRSMLALPLIAGDRKLGAALISFNQHHHFSPDEIALGDQVSAQIALSIAKVKLVESESRRAAQFAALHSVSQMVVSSLDLNQIFDTVIQVLRDTYGYAHVSIYRLDGETLHLGALAGFVNEPIFQEIPISRGVFGRAVRTRQIQFIQDVKSDPDFLKISEDMESEICIPVLVGQKVLGVLNIETPAGQILTEGDVGLLSAFANQVAIAIDHAILFAETQLRAKKERLLLEATNDFIAALSEEAVLGAVARHMTSALGGVGCTISSWDADRDLVVTLLDYGTVEGIVLDSHGSEYPLSEFPATRWVIEHKKPLFIRAEDPDGDSAERALMEKFEKETVLLLPLAAGHREEVYGIIELYGKKENPPYLDSDLELAHGLAAQAALALENARLYAEVQRLAIVDELTGLYNRRGFYELGRRELDRAIRFGYPLAMLFIDIDHFKQFNDLYSYATGDRVLRMLGEHLRIQVREIDLIGRYGGEEFVVLLPQTSAEESGAVAERIRKEVEGMRVVTGQGEDLITVSIGVCQKTADLHDLEALVDRAGQVVHHAKNNGRNQVVLF
jgi:diguanylate cyclase (GGDEF)-like protein/PAS domain S-box-containing protein